MALFLRIDDDLVKWAVADGDRDALLTALNGATEPVALTVAAPVIGRLVVNPPALARADVTEPETGWAPSALTVDAALLYLPGDNDTANGPLTGHRLPVGADLSAVEAAIVAAMRGGGRYALDYGIPSRPATLVLNGARLAFAAIVPPHQPGPAA